MISDFVQVVKPVFQEGKLLLKDVSKVWADYPADLHPWLLRLTEEFDLTCPLGDEEASIVPCLLPDEEPQVIVTSPPNYVWGYIGVSLSFLPSVSLSCLSVCLYTILRSIVFFFFVSTRSQQLQDQFCSNFIEKLNIKMYILYFGHSSLSL